MGPESLLALLCALALLAGMVIVIRRELQDLDQMQRQSEQGVEFMRWVYEEWLPAYCRENGIDHETLRREAELLITEVRY